MTPQNQGLLPLSCTSWNPGAQDTACTHPSLCWSPLLDCELPAGRQVLLFPESIPQGGAQGEAGRNPAPMPLISICRAGKRPQEKRKRSLGADSYPKPQLLTSHTLCINNILCGFSYCTVQRFTANFVHSSGVQSPLLFGGSKGFDARIHLCIDKSGLSRDRLGTTTPSCVTVGQLSTFLTQDYLACKLG